MKRISIAVFALASLAAFAQQPQPAAAPAAPQAKPVVIINGDVITDQKLDQLYSSMKTQMRTQYDKNGGKAAFLDNYLRKRLIVQDAIRNGFDKRPEIQAEVEAAKETALFEAYIREVVSKSVVSDAEIKKYFDEHQSDFATPEGVNVRHIIIMADGAGPKPKSKAEAAMLIQKVAEELRQKTPVTQDADAKARILLLRFAEAARQYSEDGSATSGGSLGWVTRGSLDPAFEEVAFTTPPGTMSAVLNTRFGYHLIFVEGKRPAGTESFAQVRSQIREFLQSQRMSDIMETVTKLSNELRKDSKVSTFPENLH
jgi:peptidyl-prolyl cis-trans isomerase C